MQVQVKAPFPPTGFRVMVCATDAPRDVWVNTETEALEAAEKLVSPLYPQVSIFVHTTELADFGVLHYTYDPATRGWERTDWRVWRGEGFEGGFPIGCFSPAPLPDPACQPTGGRGR